MDYKLEDLIDIPLLQSLQGKLNAIYSFPSAIIDNDGKVLTAVAWQDICTKFHRTNPECEKECIKSDQYILEHLHEANPAVSYQCAHGLSDNATPIIVDGKHLGNFFTGQFFLEEPDLKFFKKQAIKYGFDEKAYLEAVEKVPIWTKKKLALYLDFIKGFIEVIAGLGLKNLKEIETKKIVREQEERLVFYTNNSPMAVVEWDSDFIVTKWTGESEKMFGWSAEETIGKPIMDLNMIYEPDIPIVEKTMENLINRYYEHVVSTNRNYRKDRSIITCEWYNTILTDENKKMLSVLSQVLDITERKKAEEELQNKQLLLLTLIDNIPDAISAKDLDCRKTLSNLADLHNIGAKSESEVLGKDDFDLFTKEIAEKFIADDKSVMQNGIPLINREEFIFDKNGQKQWLLTSKLPLQNQNGQIIGLVGIGRDITKRKEAEENLQQSLVFNETLLKTIPYGMNIVDESGTILFQNDIFKIIFGENVIGKKCWELYKNGKKQCDDCPLSTGITFGETGVYESSGVRDNRIFEVSYTIMMYQGKKAMLEIFQDITERKKAELALKKSEENFRTLVENVGEGIGFTNPDEEFVFANPAAERIFAVGKGELTGKNLKEFVKEEHYLVMKSQTKLRKKGQSSVYENELNLPDGKKRDIIITAVPQFDDNKTFIGTYAIFRDITERKQIESELLKSELKLDYFFNQSTAGAFFMMLDEPVVWNDSVDKKKVLDYVFEHHRIAKVNQAMLEQYRTTEKDFMGLTPKDLFAHDLEYGQSVLTEVFDKGKLYIDTDERRFDGSQMWVLGDYTCMYDSQGRVTGHFGIQIDITKRKKAEDALLESEEKLVQLNADKDRFISILGHDLKSPFNNLLGLSEILTEDISKLDIDEIKDIAKNINKSAQITNKLLEDILMWAKAQQGKNPFKPQKISFSDICKNVVDVLKPNADAKNITINCPTADYINVFADADMIKTVLRNLVSNAIKFTNKKGTININATQTNSNVTISVSDNGIGIAHDELKKLFEISEVLTTKGTEGETGTGLGLLLCKEFVEKHEGKIWVESEVGKGSAFKFTLPMSTE